MMEFQAAGVVHPFSSLQANLFVPTLCSGKLSFQPSVGVVMRTNLPCACYWLYSALQLHILLMDKLTTG